MFYNIKYPKVQKQVLYTISYRVTIQEGTSTYYICIYNDSHPMRGSCRKYL